MMQKYDLLGHGLVMAGLIQGVGDAGRLITVGGGNYCPPEGIADAEVGAYLIVPVETGDYLVMDAETFTAHATLVEAATEGRETETITPRDVGTVERILGVGGAAPQGESSSESTLDPTPAPSSSDAEQPTDASSSPSSPATGGVEPPADVSQD